MDTTEKELKEHLNFNHEIMAIIVTIAMNYLIFRIGGHSTETTTYMYKIL